MTCGMCPFNDGMCYTSNPPKRKCTITGEFHFYDDECNCEYSRLLKEKETSGESLIECFPESAIRLNADHIAASEYEFPDIVTEYICEPITTFGTPCIICGETVFVDIYGAGPKVCNSCKEAVQFVKDKLMEKKDD
jgi:hypothetical protein